MENVPVRLFNSSCVFEKILQCSCSFHAVPTPSVQWWVGDVLVGVNSTDNDSLQVTTTTFGSWANSTISLFREPVADMILLCEGKSPNRTHALSILLKSGNKFLAPQNFKEGLKEGIVYGATAITLLFFFLLPFIVKRIKMQKAEKLAIVEAQKSIEVEAGQEPTMSLKPEEPRKPISTSFPDFGEVR